MANKYAEKPTFTHNHRSCMPFSLSPEQEEVMKFIIGLRLLGEERQQRYLAYLQQLRDETGKAKA